MGWYISIYLARGRSAGWLVAFVCCLNSLAGFQLCSFYDPAILAQGSVQFRKFLILGPGRTMDGSNRDGGHRRDRNREVGDVWRRRHGDRPSYSAVRDPTNRLLPCWLSQVGDDVIQADQTAEFTTGGSALVVDARDSRLVSPTQGCSQLKSTLNSFLTGRMQT